MFLLVCILGKVLERGVMLSRAFTSLHFTGQETRGPGRPSDSPRGCACYIPHSVPPAPRGLALPSFLLGREIPGMKHL